MTNKHIRIGTFFSGIGSPEKALQKLKEDGIIDDYEIVFFSEIDENAIKSYCSVHDIDKNLNLGDITKIKGKSLPYCDIWIGGFPCQDISTSGKMKGFSYESKTRSSLGWEMIRLLNEVTNIPRCIIFENVKAITSKKYKSTLVAFKGELSKLGYKLYDSVLNASDYGIPQNRERYFLVALKDNNKFVFPEKIKSNISLIDYIDDKVEEKYYLTNSEFDEQNGKLIFVNKNNKNIQYEIDPLLLKKGGVCGRDLHTKYMQSSRIFSIYGNIPTLTANNTADNCKIVVESEEC